MIVKYGLERLSGVGVSLVNISNNMHVIWPSRYHEPPVVLPPPPSLIKCNSGSKCRGFFVWQLDRARLDLRGPILHLFRGESNWWEVRGIGRFSRVSVLASPQGLIGLVVGPFAANMFALSWVSKSRATLRESADMT
jgi:hypothetical protein